MKTHNETVWEHKSIHNLPFCIISGPSGGGKTTLINDIEAKNSNFCKLIKHTNRSPRKGEKDGVDYHFVETQDFREFVNEDNAIVYANRYSNFYGLSIDELHKVTTSNRIPIVIMDTHLAILFKKKYPHSLLVFISRSSKFELCRNILKRDDRFLDKFHKLLLIREECSLSYQFDVIINGAYNIDLVIEKIETCIQRAVWRKRGSGSPESLCEFGSFCARPSVSESPAFAKPLGRYRQCRRFAQLDKFVKPTADCPHLDNNERSMEF